MIMTSAPANQVLAAIEALFAAHGHETYGEGVTIAEHSLQTAAFARAQARDDALVVAALLHDIGHFLELRDDEFGYHKHDRSGGAWLAARFPAAVSEPVRLHVAAKRYLCFIQPGYSQLLSPPSIRSLAKQGGPLSAAEAAAFARVPFADDAVRLRRWDDLGKVEGMQVRPFEDYRECILNLSGNGSS